MRPTSLRHQRSRGAEHRPRLPDGHDRAGDQDAAGADRLPERPAGLGQRHRLRRSRRRAAGPRAPGARRTGRARPRPAPRPASTACVEFCVHTISDSTGSSSPRNPSTSLSAITPTTPTSGSNVNESRIASTSAAAPCGLCAASSRIVGPRRTTSSRPGEVTAAKRLAHQLVGQRLVAGERARRRPARARRSAPGARRRAAGRPRRTHDAARAASSPGHPPPPPGARPRSRRPRAAGSRRPRGPARRAPPSRRRPARRRRPGRPGLMIPAFSTAIVAGAVAEVASRGRPRSGVTTATEPSATLVASHDPPMPTSTTATSTGRVGERGERHADDGLEERQRVRLVGVDEVEERRDVEVGLDERLLGQRLAVDADPLGHRLHVRAGEPAGAQAPGPDQASTIRAVLVLPLVPVRWTTW